MFDYEEDSLMALSEDASPVAPRKLRRLKKSAPPDLAQKHSSLEAVEEQLLSSRSFSDPSLDRRSPKGDIAGFQTDDIAISSDEELEDRLRRFPNCLSSRHDVDADNRAGRNGDLENPYDLNDCCREEESIENVVTGADFLRDRGEKEQINDLFYHAAPEEDKFDAFGNGLDFSRTGRENSTDELESLSDVRRNLQGEDYTDIDRVVNHDESPGMDGEKGKKRSIPEGEGKAKMKRKDGSINASKTRRASEISASSKRKLEKERKAYLEQLHAESQRLLRESTDVSFKTVAITKTPVSSLLEKMRRRKQELMQRSIELFGASGDTDNTDESWKNTDLVEEDLSATERKEDLVEEIEHKDQPADCETFHLVEDKHCVLVPAGDLCEDFTLKADLPVEAEVAFRSHLCDTRAPLAKDILCDSPLGDGEEQPESHMQISHEEVHFSTSLLTMNLELDSVPQDDESLDEEDDKENMPPIFDKSNAIHKPKGDPVKAFVDDEAAEEDSDGDSFHCDDEEETENLDAELKDLIATADDEMPVDREKRDMLHQQLLQEQDAAATDNLMQRLNCNFKSDILEDDGLSDNSDNDMDKYSTGEGDSRFTSPRRVVQRNQKKPKIDLFKIFPDREDVYVSSDEEETEESYLHQLILQQSDKQAVFLSTEDDENSREVFGRIKKLNIAPNNKRRPKATPSFFDSLASGVNISSSSRSSFLGRVQSNSVKAPNRTGGSVVRSFIFGRDDSNSRSGIQTSDSVNTDHVEIKMPSMGEPAKVGSSQSKARAANGGGRSTNHVNETTSGPSLFKILRRSTVSSDKSSSDKNQKCTDVTFDAFKTVKVATMIEKRVR